MDALRIGHPESVRKIDPGSNRVLAAALRLAHRLPVFPCREDKRPACKHGFKQATRDPDGIVALWHGADAPLIGVPTGAVSGFDVLDIDPRHGGDEWLALSADALPITRHHFTRSGGRHILFRHAEGVRNTASKIAPGIDTRGCGGFVIWWPAAGYAVETPGTVDEWPRWLMSMLVPPPRPRVPPPMPATRTEADARVTLMVQRAYARVRNAMPGQRHYELRAAAATLGGLLDHLDRGPDALERELVALAMAAGGENQRTAEATARWAMQKGAASPLLRGR